MKKQYLTFKSINKLFLFIVCALLMVIITGCSPMSKEQNTLMRFSLIWERDVKDVSKIDFIGRAQYVDKYYSVFNIDKESRFFDSLVFETQKDESFEILFNSVVSDIKEYDIPDMYMPNWDKQYHWLHLVTKDTTNKTPILTYTDDLINMKNCDHLYLIFDIETNSLIALEIYI